jgi:putative ABC transport system permease protein
LILVIASINYINLATASASNRAKEIGIRKASGAGKRQLILQFLGESLLITLISLLVAISLVELFMPAFSTITGKYIPTDFRFKKDILIGIFCLWFFTGLISGLYPAFFLSSIRVTNLLRRDFKLGTKSTNFRKLLVLIQFSISILLIITTFGVFRQLSYLHNADLGFKKNNIVIIDAAYEVSLKYPKFKEELLKNENIKHVTGMNYIIGSSHNTYPIIAEDSYEDGFQFYPALFVRADFVKTFQIEILSGRDFIENETNAGQELLVNEEMVKFLGYEKNEELLGKNFYIGKTKETVVGIFSNLNVTSLHYQVEPFIIRMVRDSIGRSIETKYIVIQINQNQIGKSIESIENTWEKMGFERPFEYRFLQDILDAHYSGEDVLGDLARIFTILSIVIALLGIWGLTAYITERRTREIGIRKALGASMISIISLINKEFIAIILASNLLAWPIAYFALSNWINSFAYRDFLTIWSFILASLIAILIALLTVSHKAIEAGRRNPVDSLRYE